MALRQNRMSVRLTKTGKKSLIVQHIAFGHSPGALNGVFGLPLSSMAGQVWDSIDADGFTATLAASGNSINRASSNQQAAFAIISRTIVAKVLKEVSSRGVDGAAAQAFIAAEMAAY